MKTSSILVALVVSLAASVAGAEPHTTAFTYQGSLKRENANVNTLVPMEFRIYDVQTLGVPLAAPIVQNVSVVDGVFTTELDFGDLPQSPDVRWLEVVVNSVILAPRQKIMPAPLTQGTLRHSRVFGGTVHESPFWSNSGLGTFGAPFGQSDAVYTEARAHMVMPVGCTARNLYVRLDGTTNYPATTAYLRVNGVDSALGCATAGAPPACSDAVSRVAIAAGDRVAMRFTPNFPARPITNSESEIGAYVDFSWICE